MNLIKLTLTTFLMTSLIACGGGSPDKDTDTPNLGSGDQTTGGSTGGDSGGGNTDGGSTGGDDGGSSTPEVPALGVLGSLNFKPGELSLSEDYVLVGSRLDFTVNAVDTDASNALAKNNYKYKFESNCAANSRFESVVVPSSSGEVTNTYFNDNCIVDNTITVRLFVDNADTSDNSLAISTATATFKAKLPTLGTGNGASFLEGKISGETNLVEVKTTELAINLVDTNDLNDVNKLITSPDYLISWTSSCQQGKFNVPQQSLSSSTAKTRYDASACAVDHTVTATLSSIKNPTVAIGVAATVDITVVKTINETPKLGSLVGDSFNAGKLIIEDYYLIGSSFEFVVNSINSDKANELTKKNYQYEFTTDCAGAGFEQAIVNSSAGLVKNKLLLKSNTCAGEGKTVTVELFAENDAVRATVLSTATATFDAIIPKLGVGSGATFIDQKMDGELNLVDKTSTILNLNAVDPSSSNEIISSADYFVKWTVSGCPTASFSVESQSLFTPEVQTRYDHDTSCPAGASDNLNVIATLYSKLAPADAITSIEKKLTIVAFNPDLGRGSEATFVDGELELELASISAGGTSNITASIVDLDKSEELIDSKNYAVKFTSECASLNPPKANFSAKDSVVITKTGKVETSYTAQGCSGSDLITATLHELVDGEANTAIELASATAAITVAEPEFGTIAFVSNSNEIMTFTGIANSTMKSSSLVTFNVTDSANNPIVNAEVKFSLSAQSASATASLSVAKGRTDADGNVSTTVRSGTSHGVLSVIAETEIVPDPIGNPGVTAIKRTSSLPISVTTGVAVQSNFSVSAEKFSVNSYGVDGVEIKINARLGDRYGNHVAEGTVVNFTAESGVVTSNCLTDAVGACEVTWSSQGDRPGQFSDTTASAKNKEYLPVEDPNTNLVISPISYALQDAKGYTTITAYAIGEAGFLDKNANGIFDDDEAFEAYPGVYRDDNYNEAFDDGLEEFFSIDQASSYPLAPTVYEGPLCSEAAELLGHCERSVYLTKSIRILQSYMGDGYGINFYKKTGVDTFVELTTANTAVTPFDVSSDGDLYMLVRDQNGNMPESGVTLTFTTEKFKAVEPKTISAAKGLVLTTPGLPNRGFLHAVTIYNDTAVNGEVDQLEVKISGGEGKYILNITP